MECNFVALLKIHNGFNGKNAMDRMTHLYSIESHDKTPYLYCMNALLPEVTYAVLRPSVRSSERTKIRLPLWRSARTCRVGHSPLPCTRGDSGADSRHLTTAETSTFETLSDGVLWYFRTRIMLKILNVLRFLFYSIWPSSQQNMIACTCRAFFPPAARHL